MTDLKRYRARLRNSILHMFSRSTSTPDQPSTPTYQCSNSMPMDRSDSESASLGIAELADTSSTNLTLLSLPAETSRDEWLGRDYLQCAIRPVLLTMVVEEAGNELDAYLQVLVDAFNYNSCCDMLHRRGVRPYQQPFNSSHFQGHVDFRSLLNRWIGAIVRRGEKREKRILLLTIREHINPQVIEQQLTDSADLPQQSTDPPVDITNPNNEENRSNGSDTETAGRPEPPLWQYTSLLWEKCSQQGFEPRCTDKQLVLHPPLWQVIVQCNSHVEVAEARNIKEAKHLASRKMCAVLEIAP